MKQTIWSLAFVLFFGFAAFAFAGDGHRKCDKSTQDCLDALAAKYQDHGWVGIELDHAEKGAYKVTRVVPDSPAEAAGLRRGDVLVALNGVSFAEENKAKLKAAKKGMKAGGEVTYTVQRDSHEKRVAVTLASVPTEVLAQWVGQHMLEQHSSVQLASIQ